MRVCVCVYKYIFLGYAYDEIDFLSCVKMNSIDYILSLMHDTQNIELRHKTNVNFNGQMELENKILRKKTLYEQKRSKTMFKTKKTILWRFSIYVCLVCINMVMATKIWYGINESTNAQISNQYFYMNFINSKIVNRFCCMLFVF